MTLTPRAVAGFLFLSLLLSAPCSFGYKKLDIPSSQNGFFDNCTGGGSCPILNAKGTVTLTGTDKSGNSVTVTINLFDWGCKGCSPQINASVLDVVLTGTTTATVQTFAFKGVLSNPDFVSCFLFGQLEWSIGCDYNPTPDADDGQNDLQQPTPISSADGNNTRWDFVAFDQITCLASNRSPRQDPICSGGNLGEAVLTVSNSTTINAISTDANKYLVILTDGSKIGNKNVVPASPTRLAQNNTQATEMVISGAEFQDFIDTSQTFPQINPDGTEQFPNGFAALPLTNPPPCNPTNEQTGNPTNAQGGASDPGSPDDRTFRTVWYSYTPASNGTVTIDTSGSRYDTLLYVFTGSATAPTQISCDDDQFDSSQRNDLLPQAVTTFPVNASTTYQIVVAETPTFMAVSLIDSSTTGYPLSVDGTLYFNLQFVPVSTPTAAPFVDIVNPVSVLPSSNILQLTVRGANFASGATVSFNGTTLTPATVSPSKIMVNSVAAPTKSLTAPVIVVNPTGTAIANVSNVAFLPVTKAITPLLLGATSISALGTASPIAVDLNGDGKVDLVAANSGATGIVVALGNGDGTFKTPASYTGGSQPVSVAVADFNGDGKPDLVAANQKSNTVSVYLNNGDGTFQKTSVDPPVGNSPVSVVAGDFNGDGFVDLAVGNQADETVAILLGNGNGTFQSAVPLTVPGVVEALALGDFNGDGKLDIAVANGGALSSSNTVSVLLGNGNGTFQLQGTNFATGKGPVALATGDFDRDGKLDLAVANQTGGSVSVLLGKGDGTFKAHVDYPTGTDLTGLAVGELNGDNQTDIAAVGSATVSVLFGHGDGTFLKAANVAETEAAGGVSFADFNNDGRLDMVTAGSSTGTVVLIQTRVTLSSTSLTFPIQLVGTTSGAMNVTLTNNGTATLNITSITPSGDFGETNTCGSSVAANASCIISVTFTPTTTGNRTGSVVITDNASSQTITLTGTGTVIELNPPSLTFPTEKVGVRSPGQTVTLTNVGTTAVSITKIAFGGADPQDFSKQTTCGTSVNAGASCTITLVFKPTATGSRTATLSVSDNGGGSPQQVALSGTGD